MTLDYVEKALSRLTSQFEESPKLRALLAAAVGALQAIEADTEALRVERWIDSAEGVQLDGCGYLVGELRQGRDDPAYRKAIAFRIFANVSEGTPRDLMRGLQLLSEPDDTQYLEAYPATAILFTDGTNVENGIQETIQSLAPAAIHDVPVLVSYGEEPFRFSRQLPPGELFVNGGDDYLTANGSDLQVSVPAAAEQGSALGGVVPAELWLGGSQFALGGDVLAVHSPAHALSLGHDVLTGVFA